MRGRIRTIKPEAFDDPDLGALPPLVRWYFAGLWTQADRRGRLRYEPGRLRSRLVPYDVATDDALESLTAALEAAGFVCRYTIAGAVYLFLPGFERHQRPNHREPESVLPEPPESPDPNSDGGHSQARTGTHGHALGERKGTELEGNGNGAPTGAPALGVSLLPEPCPRDLPLGQEALDNLDHAGCKDVLKAHAHYVASRVAGGKRKVDWPADEAAWALNHDRYGCPCQKQEQRAAVKVGGTEAPHASPPDKCDACGWWHPAGEPCSRRPSADTLTAGIGKPVPKEAAG